MSSRVQLQEIGNIAPYECKSSQTNRDQVSGVKIQGERTIDRRKASSALTWAVIGDQEAEQGLKTIVPHS
jgi:hypothetical protein